MAPGPASPLKPVTVKSGYSDRELEAAEALLTLSRGKLVLSEWFQRSFGSPDSNAALYASSAGSHISTDSLTPSVPAASPGAIPFSHEPEDSDTSLETIPSSPEPEDMNTSATESLEPLTDHTEVSLSAALPGSTVPAVESITLSATSLTAETKRYSYSLPKEWNGKAVNPSAWKGYVLQEEPDNYGTAKSPARKAIGTRHHKERNNNLRVLSASGVEDMEFFAGDADMEFFDHENDQYDDDGSEYAPSPKRRRY